MSFKCRYDRQSRYGRLEPVYEIEERDMESREAAERMIDALKAYNSVRWATIDGELIHGRLEDITYAK